LSARKLPPPAKLAKLLTVLDTTPYPVLVHCQAGADRTGLVCTLYENIYQHVPIDQAEEQQLTWRDGHFSFGSAHPMNDFFNLYRNTGNGMDLRTWILKRYPAVYKTAA
jgi:undecaprenyl-diphosphatase